MFYVENYIWIDYTEVRDEREMANSMEEQKRFGETVCRHTLSREGTYIQCNTVYVHLNLNCSKFT